MATSASGEFTPNAYRHAAIERMGVLRGLYDSGEYVLGLYVAGLAVESILRAYRVMVDPEFSSRHDLHELAKESKLPAPEKYAERFAASLGAVAVRWSNNHRYRSAISVRRFLKRLRLDRSVKGDALKENARRAITAAIDLVSLGDQLWTKLSKS